MRTTFVAAHCNYVDDQAIRLLKLCEISVAYCPRASNYFGHQNHRYLEMIDAGVNVCLGTDSIICHGTLSILDEMRFLYQRDKCNPEILLKMATVNGLRALRPDIDCGDPWVPDEPKSCGKAVLVLGGGRGHVCGWIDVCEIHLSGPDLCRRRTL